MQDKLEKGLRQNQTATNAINKCINTVYDNEVKSSLIKLLSRVRQKSPSVPVTVTLLLDWTLDCDIKNEYDLV